jgi:hypothetical protein
VNRFLQLAVLATAVVFAAASSPQATYSPASSTTYPPKPAGCELEVLSTPPADVYDEIGTFDIEQTYGSQRITTGNQLRELIGPQACQLGADGLIAFAAATPEGVAYRRAVAFKYRMNVDE